MNKKNMKYAYTILVFFAIYFFLPFIMTGIYAFSTEWGKTFFPTGMTVQWMKQLFLDISFIKAVLRSLILATTVLLFILCVMLPTVLTIVISFPNLNKYMQGMSLMPYVIPGVILVTALLKMYAKLNVSMLIVLAGALFVMSIPVIYFGLYNSLISINTKQLIEAGKTLGATSLTLIFKVIIPNIRIGVVLSSVMIFSALFGEYLLTNLLIGGRFETLRIYMLRRMNENGHLASAVMMFYFVCILIMGLQINHLSKKLRNET